MRARHGETIASAANDGVEDGEEDGQAEERKE